MSAEDAIIGAIPIPSGSTEELDAIRKEEDRPKEITQAQYRIKLSSDLVAQGYAVTSRKKCIVARINRPDFKEYMESKGLLGDADCYRRSKYSDTLIISPDLVNLIPNSSNCEYEYRERIKQEG